MRHPHSDAQFNDHGNSSGFSRSATEFYVSNRGRKGEFYIMMEIEKPRITIEESADLREGVFVVEPLEQAG